MEQQAVALAPTPALAGCKVILRKCQNVIDISPDGRNPLPDDLRRLLEPGLQYDYIQRHYGADAYDPIDGRPRKVTVIPKRIFRYDKYGKLVTNFGFSRRIYRTLRQAGVQVATQDLYPDSERKRPNCYTTDWENVTSKFEFRPKQEECLRAIMQARCGVIHAVTGFGKMAMMAMVGLLYPQAKIYIVTKGRSLVGKTVEYLTRYLPNIGQFDSTRKKWGSRINVFSVDSLHHCDFDCDFLLGDEVHLLITPGSSADLARFQESRNFGFSATPSGRIDGTDKRVEALFGETIFHISYQEAQALGLVVPIVVEVTDVDMATNPVDGIEQDAKRKRWGIWCNDVRNDIVAAKALEFPTDQVMIMVDTVEHGMHLYQRLGKHGYVLVTDDIDPVEFHNWKKAGFIPMDYPRMKPSLRESLRQKFEAGTLRKVITTIWDTGIDPTHLGVVVRAAGGASVIQDQQEPGRVARIVKDDQGRMVKSYGVVCDFLDHWDENFENRSGGRVRTYKKMGWKVVRVKGDLRQEL